MEQIGILQGKYQADIESMEGAALHFVCLQEGIPFLQIRGISNFVGERNKAKWDLKSAIENSNRVALQILKSM
jgi:futalosine hydrolase